MHRSIPLLLVAACALLAVNMAMAQGPGGQDFKVGFPDFGESDVVTITIPPIHVPPNAPPPSVAGWAGVIISIHNLDNQEVDVDRVFGNPFMFPGQGAINPLGPRSSNVQSQVHYVKLLPGQFPQSGIDVTPSMYIPTNYLAGVDVHIKGTQIGQNSDTDLVIDVHNIWHVRQDSVIWGLSPSDLVWGPPIHTSLSNFVVPPTGPPITESADNWFHVPTFQQFHFLASDYFATLVTLYTVGIEHFVPEPTAAMLMVAGVGCAVTGRWFRRRRKAAIA